MIEESRDELIDYLSQAKWVHISSLIEFDQFEWFMDTIKEAKDIAKKDGHVLMVSMDPGNTYMSHKEEALKKHFTVCDYVFLSGSEANFLKTVSTDMPTDVSYYVEKGANCKFVANVSRDLYRIITVKDGWAIVRDFPAKEYSIIGGDTSSGSVFAGGFIYRKTMPTNDDSAAIDSASLSEALKLTTKGSPFETTDIKTGTPINIRERLTTLMNKTEEAAVQKYIFISHANRDREFIDSFVVLLSSAGINSTHIFYSSGAGYGITAGGEKISLSDELLKKMKGKSTFVIYVLSESTPYNVLHK